jgi:FMN phosphatase YigB (HAD superfamily)
MTTIAVDFDDTLVPFLEPFLEWHNHKAGTKHDMSQVISYKFSESLGGDNDYWETKIDEFLDAGIQNTIGPFAGSVEALKRLGADYRLIIVTSRPERQRAQTQKLLDTFFLNLFAELHMRDDYSTTHDKGEVCKHLGAAILIDDGGHNIVAAQRAGIHAIMFGDFPSQAEHVQNYHKHAMNWQDVEKMIDSHGLR